MTVEDSDEGGAPPICSDELLHVQYLAIGGKGLICSGCPRLSIYINTLSQAGFSLQRASLSVELGGEAQQHTVCGIAITQTPWTETSGHR